MNDIDTIVRETLQSYAAGMTPDADLTARAVRRGRTLRHRRIVTAGALTVTALGVASFVGLAALGHDGRTGRDPRVQIGSSPSANTSPAPSPTISSQSAAGCPDGQAPEVSETGTVSATGSVEPNQGAQPVTQLVVQSYLRAVFNQQPISAYGSGVDSVSHDGVIWVTFQSGRTVEIVPDRANTTWSAYPARLGSCAVR